MLSVCRFCYVVLEESQLKSHLESYHEGCDPEGGGGDTWEAESEGREDPPSDGPAFPLY